MIIGMKKTVSVDVKTIEVFAKVRDEGTYTLKDQDGEIVARAEECYVPNSIIPGSYGDYISLVIDLETGFITNWKKPTASDLEEFISEHA